MKIISWNVNGIRAVVKKDFFVSLQNLNADIVCLQETKAQDNEVSKALSPLTEYQINSNSAKKRVLRNRSFMQNATFEYRR